MHQETLLHETENRKNAKLKNSTNSNFFAKKFEISMKLSTFDQKIMSIKYIQNTMDHFMLISLIF